MIKEIWKKCNIVTFVGIMFTILGIWSCYKNEIPSAIIMLALSGICDAIDGPIARKINKGNSNYGVQLDSLADIVAFGILPIIICMQMGYIKLINLIIYVFFAICGITRLAYYNTNSSDEKYFTGLPITCSAMAMPLIFIIMKNEIAFMATLSVLAICFVSNIKINKPTLKVKIILSLVGIAILIYIVFFEYLNIANI